MTVAKHTATDSFISTHFCARNTTMFILFTTAHIWSRIAWCSQEQWDWAWRQELWRCVPIPLNKTIKRLMLSLELLNLAFICLYARVRLKIHHESKVEQWQGQISPARARLEFPHKWEAQWELGWPSRVSTSLVSLISFT